MANRGNIDYGQIRQAARKGQGSQVQMFGGGATTPGHVATYNAAGDLVDGGAGGGGAGTVTSVALTMPPEFAVANSPVTAAGTLAVSKASQSQNLVWASPASGSGPPVFRALVAADIPAGIGGAVASVFGRSGAVVAQAGDYSVGQVTGAAAQSIVFTAGAGLTGGGDLSANRTFALAPATATTIGGVKIGSGISVAADGTISATGGSGGGQNQTPWLSNIDTAGFSLTNVTGSPGLNIGAGAGTLALQTSAKTRLAIDSAGSATLYPNDSGNATFYFATSGNCSLIRGAGGGMNIRGLDAGLNLLAAGAGFTVTTSPTVGTSGPQRMFIDPAGHVTINAPDNTTNGALNVSGNVGIGTTTPATILHVRKAGAGFAPFSATGIFVENAGSAAYIETACANVGDSCGYLFSSGASLTSYIIDLSNLWTFYSTRPVAFYAGSSERMRITASGNVGIGTTAPAQPLHVAGTGANDGVAMISTAGGNVARLMLENYAAGGRRWDIRVTQNSITPAGGLCFVDNTAGLARLNIDASGNVGIGATPAYRLDVAGDVNVTGAYRVNGVPLASAGTLNHQYATTFTTLVLAVSVQIIPNFTITIPNSGTYVIEVMVLFTGNAGPCMFQMYFNGGNPGGAAQIPNCGVSGTYWTPAIWKFVRTCIANDKVTVGCAQTGGSGAQTVLQAYMTALQIG